MWFRGPSSCYTSPPTLIMCPNGTYDWSYGLHSLIRQLVVQSSRLFMPFSILVVTTLDHRSFRQELLRPSHARVPQSTHLTPIYRHIGADTRTSGALLSHRMSGVVEDYGCCRSGRTVGVEDQFLVAVRSTLP